MSYVKFQHNSYGTMFTAPEFWIQYEVFDALDEDGESHPVKKEDCCSPKYIE